MYWLNLEQSGFAVSIEKLNGKKQFFLKKKNDTADKYLSKISDIGFITVENEENLYTAPLNYVTRNQLLSFNGAFLFPTTIEAKHEDPFLGFRDIRPRSPEAPDTTLPQEARGNEENRGDQPLSGNDRSGGSEEDSRPVSEVTGGKPIVEGSGSPGSGVSQHQVDEDSQASSDEGNDISSSGSGVAGSGDGRDGSMEPVAAGNGRSGRGGSGLEDVEAEIVEENRNPNHFDLNEESFWTEFSNKDRFDANLEAIKTIKEIEKREEPVATVEEKQIMARYAGWGSVSISKISGQYEHNISKKYDLTDEEQQSLFRSSLDAYYTSPAIIKPIWKSIQDHLGFKGGEILDPAVGVGNFLGWAPKLKFRV